MLINYMSLRDSLIYIEVFSYSNSNSYVIDTVQVFHPKCPLTTARRRFSADELQIVRGEAEDPFVVRPHFNGF